MRRIFALIVATSSVFAEAGGQETAAPDDAPSRSGATRRIENVRRPGPLFARVDADGDGKVTRQEMPRMPKDRFDTIDKNKDGVLDQAEFQTLMSRTIRRPAAQRAPLISKTLVRELDGDYWPKTPRMPARIDGETLPAENVSGDGIWLDPALQNLGSELFRVTVWFDQQFLGDGEAYARRCQGFSGQRRGPLRARVINTLKTISDQSYQAAEDELRKLAEDDKVFLIDWHWIVNGFSCVTTADGLIGLQKLPGVKNIFLVRGGLIAPRNSGDRETIFFPPVQRPSFEPSKYEHPWYTRYLLADKVWKRFGVSGEGTLNVVMDGGFVLSPSITSNLYRNDREVPDNGKDDDQNGLVDDYHGFDFSRGRPLQAARPPENLTRFTGVLHGFTCASLICGTGHEGSPYEFGLAPQGSWAGVTANVRFESAIEWAIEQGADTLSMSFSRPNLGEHRSHWRKVMEHASLCGVCCTSGAGNFAQEGTSTYAPVPVQLRTPEDIPLAVFAPAGVQRDLGRAPFSSQGPVKWETEHYRDGLVQKPEFCAFNSDLPWGMPDGTVRPNGVSGNSFAGPMVAGALALMFSADRDLLPWNAREILANTATDVAAPGIDHQTGHGLINCYRAVKEVLRRKAAREGGDTAAYEGREDNDALMGVRLESRYAEPVFE